MSEANTYLQEKKVGFYLTVIKTFAVALIIYLITATLFSVPIIQFIKHSYGVDADKAEILLYLYTTIFAFFSALLVSTINNVSSKVNFSPNFFRPDYIFKYIIKTIAMTLTGTAVTVVWAVGIGLSEPKITDKLSITPYDELYAAFGLCVFITAIIGSGAIFINYAFDCNKQESIG